MNRFYYINFLVCCFYILSAQNVTKEQYINTYRDIAIKEMHRCGIPASITLAQGILESRYGNSELALMSNNHFGIKCHSDWGGKKVYYDDDELQECFRKYKKPEESFFDHSDFILSRQRYAELFKLRLTDYKGWAHGLKSCGYATDPKYAHRLIAIIEEYNLHEIDKSDLSNKRQKVKAGSIPLVTDVFEYNRIKTVLAQDDDTYEKIAIEYDVNLKRLLDYNDLEAVRKLNKGEKVFLQPKRTSGGVKYHEVNAWETMYDISQKYGIRLSNLYARNLMEQGQEPEAGERLWLRSRRAEAPKLKKKQESLVTKEYTVQAGETLYSIARRYNIPLDELKSMNNLTSNDLKVGQIILIKE